MRCFFMFVTAVCVLFLLRLLQKLLHSSKSCQKVAEQLVAEANWGRSRGCRNAPTKTSSETQGQKMGALPCPRYLPLGLRGCPRPFREGEEKTKNVLFSRESSVSLSCTKTSLNSSSPTVGSKNCAFYDKRMKLGTLAAHIFF